MGSPASKLAYLDKPYWEEPHELNIDIGLRDAQRVAVNKLKSPIKLCYVLLPLHGLDVEHWYITDGTYCVEYGDFALQDRGLRIYATAKRENQIVDKTVEFGVEVKRRLQSVCGARNGSLALRNSEHMAKYIVSGSWLSLQMVGGSRLLKALAKELGDKARLVNTPPGELVEPHRQAGASLPMYRDLRSRFHVQYAGKRQTLHDNSGATVVVLGPTGAGKSSIVNMLFNRRVALVKASPLSVTRHMDVYCGSYFDIGLNETVPLNVVDSIGFCDSVIPPQEVLQMVKGYIKANMWVIAKVVIVCASRIEREQCDAIRNFMRWLKYDSHKAEFVFVYNKADHLDEVERAEAVRDMCTLLDADPTYSVAYPIGADEFRLVKYAIAVGFPPRAPLLQVQSDIDALYDAIFVHREDSKGIQVSERSCAIL